MLYYPPLRDKAPANGRLTPVYRDATTISLS